MEEHTRLIRQVLQKLLAAKLFVKFSKCEFHRMRLDYQISSEGVEMDPCKVQAVLGWQAPRTENSCSFLSFANFYQQFVPSFARVALPLTDLLHTKPTIMKPRLGKALKWMADCQQVFEELKALFACEPVLKHTDPTQAFVVQADASDVAIGAVLLQTNS